MWRPGMVVPVEGGWSYTVVSPLGQVMAYELGKISTPGEAKVQLRNKVVELNTEFEAALAKQIESNSLIGV